MFETLSTVLEAKCLTSIIIFHSYFCIWICHYVNLTLTFWKYMVIPLLTINVGKLSSVINIFRPQIHYPGHSQGSWEITFQRILSHHLQNEAEIMSIVSHHPQLRLQPTTITMVTHWWEKHYWDRHWREDLQFTQAAPPIR